jgi:trehalose synthase
MLETVNIGTQGIKTYEASAGADIVEQLRELAAPLRDIRVLHLNATPYGGGVAEILRSEVPLLRDLGIDADWKIITGNQQFFEVTKLIHNGLQGATRDLSSEEQEIYLANAARNAQLLEEEYDLVIAHDPQPLAMRQFLGSSAARWIWRCHIDTSEPNPQVWQFLRPYLAGYDAAVFTLGGFVPPDFPIKRVEIIPPAIDPESPKNIDLGTSICRQVLSWIGVALDRPLVTQVSRFDPWKDPLGVIAAYRRARDEVPGLQLALVGSMALDDPEGWRVYHEIEQAAKGDPDLHVFTNLTGVGNIEVNAFQRHSNVVVQKSIREGFGLVVSEALWKGTPVVAGRAGGIPLQMQDGVGGFLVDSVDECADRLVWLLQHPDEGRTLAGRGRTLVRERFLLTRLIADELRLIQSVVNTQAVPATSSASTIGLAGERRDPVCGTRVGPTTPNRVTHNGTVYLFCSKSCLREFETEPERFLRAEVGSSRS